MSDWMPERDEWYLASIRKTMNGYAFGTLSNGEDVFIHFNNVIPHKFGHMCIGPGDEVLVTLKLSSNRSSSARWVAIHCELQRTSRTFSERGHVTRWYGDTNSKGLVALDCGCTRKVILRAPAFVKEGDLVELNGVVPDTRNPGKFIALEIDVIPEEDSNESD